MPKECSMGSKRQGAHINKGMGRCTGKHAKQCGAEIDLSDKNITIHRKSIKKT